MTKTQKEALNRVSARWAYSQDNEAKTGTYQTDDVYQVLELVEDQKDKIHCIVDDLNDLRMHLKGSNNDETALAMVDSALEFLTYEE